MQGLCSILFDLTLAILCARIMQIFFFLFSFLKNFHGHLQESPYRTFTSRKTLFILFFVPHCHLHLK